jgi:hypothetical protein
LHSAPAIALHKGVAGLRTSMQHTALLWGFSPQGTSAKAALSPGDNAALKHCSTLAKHFAHNANRDQLLHPCAAHFRNNRSPAKNPKNTTEITPFMVKNAAFSFERLVGETRKCS